LLLLLDVPDSIIISQTELNISNHDTIYFHKHNSQTKPSMYKLESQIFYQQAYALHKTTIIKMYTNPKITKNNRETLVGLKIKIAIKTGDKLERQRIGSLWYKSFGNHKRYT
jgi:hypothetical protein